jgi:5-methylcytosine-specific restriction protein A
MVILEDSYLPCLWWLWRRVSLPRQPCLDCGAPATGPRCPVHTRRRDANRGTTTQRGYGSSWQRVAKAAIARQPWCSDCGATEDLTADHVVMRVEGGSGDPANVEVCCRPCNTRRSNRRRALLRRAGGV